MAVRVVEFSNTDTKFEDSCLKIKKPKGNYWILSSGLTGRCQKVPTFDFQSQFSKSKIIQIFLNFFHWRISIFKSLYFLKWCPIFDTSPWTQFSKFNNFLWVCWFLGKNLSNSTPPSLKTRQPVLPYVLKVNHWEQKNI